MNFRNRNLAWYQDFKYLSPANICLKVRGAEDDHALWRETCAQLRTLMKEIFDLKMKKGDSGEISERRIQVCPFDVDLFTSHSFSIASRQIGSSHVLMLLTPIVRCRS